jgi:hypothetical protein
MPFKELSSFLRFVSMGALGTRSAMTVLREAGHVPIELERYCSSNKIWTTKIKRLRLPDLVCTRCGQRFEVRGKSKLEIKMSDSPTKPDRRWDSGLRDQDMALFLTIHEHNGRLVAARTLNPFLIGSLRAAAAQSKLGPPKSASEGAERDRTWPSWVPPRDGTVLRTQATNTGTGLVVAYADGGQYTYRSIGKHPHLAAGTTFVGGEVIAASVVDSTASIACPGQTWQPALDLEAEEKDLYAALKVLATEPRNCDLNRLRDLQQHADRRIGLEATKALAARGHADAIEQLQQIAFAAGDDAPWAMEAVLILTELGRPMAELALNTISAGAPHPEVRAASTWGLGVIGSPIQKLIAKFDDPDSIVVLHAIVAASRSARTADAIAALIECFGQHTARAAAACEALSLTTTNHIDQVLAAASGADVRSRWALACLARLPAQNVMASASWNGLSHDLKVALEQMWFWEAHSPFAVPTVAADIDALNLQLFPTL